MTDRTNHALSNSRNRLDIGSQKEMRAGQKSVIEVDLHYEYI